MSVMERLPELTADFSDQKKAQIYKFSVSLANAYEEVIDILKEHDIKISTPSHFKVLTLDPRTAIQAVELAEKMFYIEDIKKDPKKLCITAAGIIKRMGQCDALGVAYKDPETGLCYDFIFSQREFNKLNLEQALEKQAPVPEETVKSSAEDIKAHALEILKMFDSADDAERINAIIDKINPEFSEKEILLQAFREAFGLPDDSLVSEKIDAVLGLTDTEEKGMSRSHSHEGEVA